MFKSIDELLYLYPTRDVSVVSGSNIRTSKLNVVWFVTISYQVI